MKRQRNPLISTFSAHFTSTVSVALVLLVLGVVAIMGVAARNVVREIHQNFGFDVILSENATDDDIARYKAMFAAAPYVDTVEYISNEQAIAELDLGEDFVTLEFDEAPIFPPQFCIKVTEPYASSDSIKSIADRLKSAEMMVDSVEFHADMIRDINSNIRSITIVLSIVALALLLISFVLINNTIRLSIYAKRFTIHTMKLVGATPGFIRRPFIRTTVIQGLVAGIIAAACLAALLYSGNRVDASVSAIISWREAAWVLAATVVCGIVICVAASWLATNKYLRLTYDEMFS